jgi:hypothetical protein
LKMLVQLLILPVGFGRFFPRWQMVRKRTFIAGPTSGNDPRRRTAAQQRANLIVTGQHDDWPFPARWRGFVREFWDHANESNGAEREITSAFEVRPIPWRSAAYTGRRVDLLGRSLPAAPGTDPARVISVYLAAGRTTSARALAAKAAVLIDPMGRVGETIWPTDGRALMAAVRAPAEAPSSGGSRP